MLAVADIEEGVDLRKSGIRAPILVFGALSVSDLDGVFDHDLTPTISSPAAGHALQDGAAKRGATLRYHLKIDTGMNRLGFRHDNLRRTLPELLASPNLALDAVHTHFGTADEPGHTLFETQRTRFEAACRTLDELGAGPRLRHAANSAALLRDSRVWFDFVRPGLLLYGLVPPPLGIDDRAEAGDVADQPGRGGEGRARRRNRRIWRPLHRRSPRDLGCHSRRLR